VGITVHPRVLIKKNALETLFYLAKNSHPLEMIALLRGKVRKDIVIEEVLLAPLAMAGEDFSEFPLDALPTDPSIVGTAHSHPVPDLRQSEEDLAENYGRVSMVIAYPYENLEDAAAYTPGGTRLAIKVL
jgi:proteasome lid subunit RPN8/RPN11